MALISLAVFDTAENKRDWMTAATLDSLLQTVDFSRHRVFISVNSGTQVTWDAIWSFAGKVGDRCTVIDNGDNIGTARAINKCWKHRLQCEMCVKMDNDVVIHNAGWADLMEEAIQRDPRIGIVGLKRVDLWERPDHPEPQHRSVLRMLPAAPDYPYWLPVEFVAHVMGTCQGYNPALLDKIGYLCQPSVYGFDDSLAAVRAKVAGFYSCFIPHIRIDHIDPGASNYTEWKREVAGQDMTEYHRLRDGIAAGRISARYDVDGVNVPEERSAGGLILNG